MRIKLKLIPIFAIIFIFLGVCCKVNAQSISQTDRVKISEYENALKIAETSGDKAKIADLLNKIAFIYMANDVYNEAIERFSRSLKINEEIKNANAIIFISREIGILYYLSNQYNQSIEYLQLCVNTSKKNFRKKDEFDALFNISTVYQAKSDKNLAIKYLQQAEGLAVELNDQQKLHSCYKVLRKLFAEVGNQVEAERYNNLFTTLDNKLTESVIDSNKRKVSESEALRRSTLHELDTIQGKVSEQEQIIALFEKQKLLQDLQIANLEKEKDLLKKQREIDEERKLKERTRLNSIIVIGILLIFLIVALYIGFQRNRKAKIILADRNIAIEEQYTQILTQRDEITQKNEQLQNAIGEINKQNKQITESINYAKTIQYSMLPQISELDAFVKDYFVFFKPRDIVSGDFYWFDKLKNQHNTFDFLIAAADCTGHGVPGAFMSMLSMKLLDETLSKGVNTVDEILENLSDGIENSFKQKGSEDRFGMDIALCIIRPEEKVVEFGGAQNPLICIQNGEIKLMKGTKRPIGKTVFEYNLKFEKNTLKYTEGDTFYVFSDGYMDQFGGDNRRKYYSKRFHSLLFDIHIKPMKQQAEILEQEFVAWKGENEQVDDILIIGFKL